MTKPVKFLLMAIACSVSVQFVAAAPVMGQFFRELKASGITPSLLYDGEAFSNIAGGIRQGTTYIGDLNVHLAIDGDRLVGWQGGSVFFNGQWLHGGRPAMYSGDAEGVSNIAARGVMQLYEAWVQQDLLGNHLSVLAGLYDLNSEFYRLSSAGLFLNSSFGIGPAFSHSGVAGPSVFPRTAWGLRLAFKPMRKFTFRVGILDGVPWRRPSGIFAAFQPGDGLLLVSEADLLWGQQAAKETVDHRMRIGRLSNRPPYDTKLAVGFWHYTTTLKDLSATNAAGDPILRHGSSGVYFLADHLMFASGSKRLSAFAQIGFGDQQVDRFGAYTGGGLVMTGLFPGSPTDQLGLGVAAAYNGSHYMIHQEQLGKYVSKAETVIEMTCLIKGTGWLAVQPDIQYVISPNTRALKNALVAQMFFEFSLS